MSVPTHIAKSCHLRKVETPEDWQALHRIRRAVLFAPGRRSYEYDDNHPDDRAAANTPYLLVADGEAVGVARLDRHETFAIVRQVAIVADKQRMGHGRILSELLDAEAKAARITELRVSANTDVVRFYEKTGWHRMMPAETEPAGSRTGSVRMAKTLR